MKKSSKKNSKRSSVKTSKKSPKTLKSKKTTKNSKNVSKENLDKKNTKVKKRSAVKKNKINKQKGGSQVGKNYDEGCNQLTKKTCVKNNDCMWLGTNKCVIREKRCSICLQNIFSLTKEKGKTVSKQVLDLAAPNNCNHVFCIDCVQRLYKSTKRCPMCRTDFDHFNNVSIDKNNVLVRSSEKVKKLDEKRNFNQYLRERENNPIDTQNTMNFSQSENNQNTFDFSNFSQNMSNDSILNLDISAIENEGSSYDSDGVSYASDTDNLSPFHYSHFLTSTPRSDVRITEEDVRRTFPKMNNDEVRNFLTNEPNAAYLQEILINMLLLWRNFDIPGHDLRNRFINLIRTSFNFNENQLNSLLWEGDGVDWDVYDAVFARTTEFPDPQWYLELINYRYTSIDDFHEYAFNMMQRYINEYLRVSMFES